MKKIDTIIIGAGPVGLFAVHQLGIKGLKAVIIDNLDKVGGQCIELYPDKPIYDIPAVPECTGKELTDKLREQIKPFNTEFFLNERVNEIKQDNNHWIVKTNKDNNFSAPNIIIAGGVGSFEPRKLSVKNAEKFEGNSLFYSIKNKEDLKNKNISIFGGGDSALDWALELSKFSKINLIHRRKEFRGAPHTLSEIKKLENDGKISIKTPGQLEKIDGDKKIKSILVSSAGPGEGKTTTVANLAITFANLGKNTLLVDTDLRRPVIHSVFEVKRDPGVTSYLSGQNDDYKELLQDANIDNLSLITSGNIPPNPSELLGSGRMLNLVNELERDYDIVLFDSPPLVAVTDANMISKEIDSILLVIKAGQTDKKAFHHTIMNLNNIEAPLDGIVMNAVTSKSNYGSYYYYYYHQYYHYYSSDNEK